MKWLLGGLATAVAAWVAVAWLDLDGIVLWALRPSGAFDPASSPAAPDYRSREAWSALPDRIDAADARVPGLDTMASELRPGDAFYVHPTTYLGDDWNAPVDDADLNETTDEVATRVQASVFNGCCKVFAPRYRQGNALALLEPSPDGERALELAYQDVRAAFHFYRERHGGKRPFVLAAHSQGAVLAARLLREEIAGKEPEQQLAVAYLIGAPIGEEPPLGVPVCEFRKRTGCVVGFNARAPGYVPGRFALPEAAGTPICVNPLIWRPTGAQAPRDRNDGAVFLHAGDGEPIPHFADARCRDGTLLVSEIGDVPRDLASRVLDRLLGEGNYHAIEYQMYYLNLRLNAAQRVLAWGQRNRPVRERREGRLPVYRRGPNDPAFRNR